MKNWKPNSWRAKTARHLPVYDNEGKLNEVLKEISKFPPLVFAGETRTLKHMLGEVSEGKAFFISRRRLR